MQSLVADRPPIVPLSLPRPSMRVFLRQFLDPHEIHGEPNLLTSRSTPPASHLPSFNFRKTGAPQLQLSIGVRSCVGVEADVPCTSAGFKRIELGTATKNDDVPHAVAGEHLEVLCPILHTGTLHWKLPLCVQFPTIVHESEWLGITE